VRSETDLRPVSLPNYRTKKLVNN